MCCVIYITLLCPSSGSSKSRRKWWEVFCPDTTESDLQDIARQVMAIYDSNDVRYTEAESVKDASGRGLGGGIGVTEQTEGEKSTRT